MTPLPLSPVAACHGVIKSQVGPYLQPSYQTEAWSGSSPPPFAPSQQVMTVKVRGNRFCSLQFMVTGVMIAFGHHIQFLFAHLFDLRYGSVCFVSFMFSWHNLHACRVDER
jgi:hypothetical protein